MRALSFIPKRVGIPELIVSYDKVIGIDLHDRQRLRLHRRGDDTACLAAPRWKLTHLRFAA